MARRSLRPHFNQIRLWVQQGRTDAWIAHQLEVTVQQIETFKRENDLSTDAESPETPGPAPDFDDEIDLRAEDDALIAAELEAEAAAREAQEAKEAAEKAEADAKEAAERAARAEAGEDEPDDEDDDDKPCAAADVVEVAAAVARPPAPTRARATTARRDTACGWIPPSPTTPSTPSTGPASARSRSSSRPTRS